MNFLSGFEVSGCVDATYERVGLLDNEDIQKEQTIVIVRHSVYEAPSPAPWRQTEIAPKVCGSRRRSSQCAISLSIAARPENHSEPSAPRLCNFLFKDATKNLLHLEAALHTKDAVESRL